jgi:hypothetical protein
VVGVSKCESKAAEFRKGVCLDGLDDARIGSYSDLQLQIRLLSPRLYDMAFED